METIKRFYVGNLTTSTLVVNEEKGAVIKTIVLGNVDTSSNEVKTATITIDGVSFYYNIEGGSTLIINSPIVCNTMNINFTGSCHISGIQLG